MLFWTLGFLALVYFLPRLWKSLASMKRQHEMAAVLPGPAGFPFIGNILDIIGGSHIGMRFFLRESARLRDEGVNVMTIIILGRVVTLPLDGEALRPLLESTEEMTKGSDYDFILPWLGTGLLLRNLIKEEVFSTETKWKSRRKMLTPTFHFNMLHGYAETMDKHARILMDILVDNADGNIDLYPFFKRCALDIICDTAMAKDLGCQRDPSHPYVKAVGSYNALAQRYAVEPWMWFAPTWYLFYQREYQKNLDILTGFTTQVIDERRKALEEGQLDFSEGEGRKTFLDMLLEMKDQNKLSFEDIREEVDTFMFAGHDTTASGISWILWCLATNSDVQEKVFEEVESIFGRSDRACTMEDSKEMRYLERCIKETMRIFPTVPIFERKLKNDFVMGKHTIPRDSEILICPMIIHHNDNVWKDHWTFDPDNFLPDRFASRHAFDYIPFSAGPRNCIGQKFALLEEKIVVSWILRRFKLHTEKEMLSNERVPEIVLRPMDGIRIILTPRV